MSKVKCILLLAGIVTLVMFSYMPTAQAQTKKGDYKKAVKLHNAAAERMQKMGGNDAEVLKLYTQAIDEYKRCITVVNKDTGEALHYLGRILYTGPKSLRNYAEAVQYLYAAADIYEKEKKPDLFIPVCYNEMGTVLYRLGDYASAVVNWKKAAELSSQFAGDEAQLYWLGLGVEQDLPKAMELYRNAAQAGRDFWANIYALDYQIKEYAKGNYDNEGMALYLEFFHALTMGEDKDVLMSTLTRAADLGWPPAQAEVWVYARENKEYSKGMPYLQKAVNAGYVPAFFHLGYVYTAGLGTRANYEEARKWYEKAAAEGHPIAQSNLGALYYENLVTAGQGLSNKEMSHYWWNIAAEQGFPLAIHNKTLVESYRPPQSKLDVAALVLNSVASILDSSLRMYSTVNKSRVQPYYPYNSQTRQTAQSYAPTSTSPSANTSSSTSGSTRAKTTPCPLCGTSGKCEYQGWGLNYCRNGRLDCSSCNGKGSTTSYGKTETCRNCRGSGKVECGICHGSGICSRCKGAKYI